MPLRLNSPRPSIEGATTWLNGAAITDADLEGHPVLVHFWAVSCHLCKEAMPTVRRWLEEHVEAGLRYVNVHMPRQQEDTDVAVVARVAAEHGFGNVPIAVDNRHAIAEAFQNEFVPAYYVFDADGKLRFRAAGKAGPDKVGGKLTEVMAAVPAGRQSI